MKWCPNCKRNFKTDGPLCPICQVVLSESKPKAKAKSKPGGNP